MGKFHQCLTELSARDTIIAGYYILTFLFKKGKRKVQEVPQSQTAALPRPQEKEETDKHKPTKRTKSTKISSLFPKRGNRNTKRTEKHKIKMTHGKTYNKSLRRINHKATKSKTNTKTTALERSIEQTTGGGGGGGGGDGGLKHLHSQPTSPWVLMPLLIQKVLLSYLAFTYLMVRPFNSIHPHPQVRLLM